MQTIATKVNISEDHKLTIQLPANIPAGEYEVVLVLSNSSPQPSVQASIAEAQALVRQFVPAERSLVAELIDERREEGLCE
ncbi:hypothetical protein NIES4071_03600 [Calothrix sp. NIES-4071]|nr:hypothetical protein NIES4071_03600 [Calothrix sp. NIES-4071]BAZ54706.1 hypothetical protein NIES4105_03590 [Calothrix sp. NIES-4105]